MDRRFIGLISILFIISALLLVLVTSALSGSGKSPIYNAVKSLVRARGEDVPSADKSLMFCWPHQQRVGGSKVDINVFVRSASETNLPDQNVVLTATLGNLTPTRDSTDGSGKAVFVLESAVAGESEVTAVVGNGVTISSRCRINFQ